MTNLWLAPCVFACVTDDGAIFLDVERDLYLGLDTRQAHALASQVADWPRACSGKPPADTRPLIASLLARGLLRECSASERVLQSASLPPASAALISWPDMNPRDVRIRDVFIFLH